MRQKENEIASPGAVHDQVGPLTWLRACYEFHSFSYRDPRAPFSVAIALPVISPTAALLGIVSTLFELGRETDAERFLRTIHLCRVKVDPPEGAIFFRAFHQLRRYITEQTKGKKEEGKNPRLGFTDINQGSREYALLEGPLTLYVGIPETQCQLAVDALRNRNHIGTHDSLCSLVGDVDLVSEPRGIIYEPLDDLRSVRGDIPVTVVTLARFTKADFKDASVGPWRMAGGANTELAPYIVQGRFRGTRSGKLYQKNGKKQQIENLKQNA